MAVNLMYTKGYEAGYRKGLQSGLSGSKARLVMERDLIFIYGTLALVLTEKHHWKQASVENLISEIQNQWRHLTDEIEGDNTETMAQIVERRTGIELRQLALEIVDGGWEE